MEPQDISLAIAAGFYDAVLRQDAWQEALNPMRLLFDGVFAHLYTLNNNTHEINNIGISENAPFWALGDYMNYYNAIDVREKHILRQPTGSFVRCHEICSDSFVRGSELYQDYLIRIGARHTMGANPIRLGDSSVVIAMLRAKEYGSYTDRELYLFRPLIGHLSKALLLQHRLQGLEQGVFVRDQALDALSFAVMTLDRSARVHHINSAAHARLQRLTTFRIKHHLLKGNSESAQSQIDRLLSDAIDRGIGGGQTFRDSLTRQQWHVWAVPGSNTPEIFGQRMAVFAFTCSEEPPVTEVILQQIFKFTRAECRLAQALAAGIDAKEYAEQSAVSIATVRSQIRAIFEKAGVKRQSDLVRLLLSSGIIRRHET